MKQKIIDGAERLFFQYGVRSVSMDDVARELSMSKKTLYQYFENKDQLVEDVADYSLQKEKVMYQDIPKESGNAIEELHHISKCIRQTVKHMNPSLMYDLQKYHSNAWAHFISFKNEFIRGMVSDNIKRGKLEGYYREDLNEDILSILRVEIIQLIFDQKAYPSSQFNLLEVQLQVYDHFVHGLLSEKGKQLYNQYIQTDAKQLHT